MTKPTLIKETELKKVLPKVECSSRCSHYGNSLGDYPDCDKLERQIDPRRENNYECQYMSKATLPPVEKMVEVDEIKMIDICENLGLDCYSLDNIKQIVTAVAIASAKVLKWRVE